MLEPYGQAIILGALCMDLFFGDPESLPHPVRLMGYGISRGERFFRSLPFNPFFQGLLLVIVLTGTAFAVSWLSLAYFGNLWPPLYFFGHGILIYYGISAKCLVSEARETARALRYKGLDDARLQVSRIVGRDTSRLDSTGVVMASIETVAENLVDAVASPIFYASLGGGPLCMAFKAISTLDSMIGYKNSKYMLFGKAAARLDDFANYLPARLTAAVVGLASPLCGGASPLHVWKTVLREGRKHESPNSGLAEASFAAALGVRLSGPAWYDGERVDRPFINESARSPEINDIIRATRLLNISTIILVLPVLLLNIFFGTREQI